MIEVRYCNTNANCTEEW